MDRNFYLDYLNNGITKFQQSIEQARQLEQALGGLKITPSPVSLFEGQMKVMQEELSEVLASPALGDYTERFKAMQERCDAVGSD